jgi:hypothetical protein
VIMETSFPLLFSSVFIWTMTRRFSVAHALTRWMALVS